MRINFHHGVHSVTQAPVREPHLHVAASHGDISDRDRELLGRPSGAARAGARCELERKLAQKPACKR